MAKNKANALGSWAFLIGVILAVVLGALGMAQGTWLYALIAIGLIIGLLNVTGSETTPFLLSGVSLIIASALGGSVVGGVPYLGDILDGLLAVFVPSTILVAIKNVFALAKN